MAALSGLALQIALRNTYTCHRCTARDMDRLEYLIHLAMAHNIVIRAGRKPLPLART